MWIKIYGRNKSIGKMLDINYSFRVDESDIAYLDPYDFYEYVDYYLDSKPIIELSVDVDVSDEDIIEFILRKEYKLSSMFFDMNFLSEKEKERKLELEKYYLNNPLEAWNFLNDGEFKDFIKNKYEDIYREKALKEFEAKIDAFYALKDFMEHDIEREMGEHL